MPYVSSASIQVKAIPDKKYTAKKLNANLEPWTIYDALCGINIEDFGLTETEWSGTLWDLLGFSYNQFHSTKNTRLERIDNTNLNNLSIVSIYVRWPSG